MRKVSMTARDELVNALARRYAVAGRAEKTRILDEFVVITGFHRKHAMRLLRCDATALRSAAKASRRIYDEAVCEAIVVLWEASDRICGKRLKALMPTLVEAMERHGHMRLGPQIRAAVLAMSASTIDRSLRQVREQASGSKRRRAAAPSSVRKSIPVRARSRIGTTRCRASSRLTPSRIAARWRTGASCRRLLSPTSPRDGPSARRFCTANRPCSGRCWARSAGGCRSNCSVSTRTTTAFS